jgi:hypothetical protein
MVVSLSVVSAEYGAPRRRAQAQPPQTAQSARFFSRITRASAWSAS